MDSSSDLDSPKVPTVDILPSW